MARDEDNIGFYLTTKVQYSGVFPPEDADKYISNQICNHDTLAKAKKKKFTDAMGIAFSRPC